MRYLLRSTIAAVTMATLLFYSSASTHAQSVRQMALTDKHVQSFIAAHKEMTILTDKMEGTTPDPNLLKQLEMAARKYGFKEFAEYDDVAANISLVMTGIDPQTKAFLEPPEAIKKEMSEVSADKSIPSKEKAEMLKELNDSLKEAQPIQHRTNIDLVKKYFEKLEALQQ